MTDALKKHFAGHLRGAQQRQLQLQGLLRTHKNRIESAKREESLAVGAFNTMKGLVEGLRGGPGSVQLTPSVQKARALKQRADAMAKMIRESTGQVQAIEREMLMVKGRIDTLAEMLRGMR